MAYFFIGLYQGLKTVTNVLKMFLKRKSAITFRRGATLTDYFNDYDYDG